MPLSKFVHATFNPSQFRIFKASAWNESGRPSDVPGRRMCGRSLVWKSLCATCPPYDTVVSLVSFEANGRAETGLGIRLDTTTHELVERSSDQRLNSRALDFVQANAPCCLLAELHDARRVLRQRFALRRGGPLHDFAELPARSDELSEDICVENTVHNVFVVMNWLQGG